MDNITGLTQQFEDLEQLKRYTAAQYHTIDHLKRRNDQLEAEITHLKHLLTKTTALVGESAPVEKLEVTKEQAICQIQIRMMEETAQQRQFTLEEAKRFEILVKTLYLVKTGGGTAMAADFTKIPANMTLDQLEAIASAPDFLDGQ